MEREPGRLRVGTRRGQLAAVTGEPTVVHPSGGARGQRAVHRGELRSRYSGKLHDELPVGVQYADRQFCVEAMTGIEPV